MSGVLFFDGACGMCTRSRDFLVRLEPHRRSAHRAATALRHGRAARHSSGPTHGIGVVAGLVRRGLRRGGGRERCRVGGVGHQAPAVDLSDPRHEGACRRPCTGGSPIIVTASRARPRTASRIRSPADGVGQRRTDHPAHGAGRPRRDRRDLRTPRANRRRHLRDDPARSAGMDPPIPSDRGCRTAVRHRGGRRCGRGLRVLHAVEVTTGIPAHRRRLDLPRAPRRRPGHRRRLLDALLAGCSDVGSGKSSPSSWTTTPTLPLRCTAIGGSSTPAG